MTQHQQRAIAWRFIGMGLLAFWAVVGVGAYRSLYAPDRPARPAIAHVRHVPPTPKSSQGRGIGSRVACAQG